MILYELGLAYDERGLPDQALTFYQDALKIKPDFSDVHNAMGAFTRHGISWTRPKHLSSRPSVTRSTPSPTFPLQSGAGLREEERSPNRSLLLPGSHPHTASYGLAHYRMGKALEALGRGDEARRAYGKAIQYSPEMAEAHVRYGVLSYNAGDCKARSIP